jgi:hypothetical protein
VALLGEEAEPVAPLLALAASAAVLDDAAVRLALRRVVPEYVSLAAEGAGPAR